MIEDSYICEILMNYFPSGDWEVWSGASGMNNTTRFVKVQNEKYVLRIYETHQDEKKVQYEHAILQALHGQQLDFVTPKLVLTNHGESIVTLPSGKLAALFRFVEGRNPSLHDPIQVQSFGRIVAQLTKALAQVKLNQPPMYRPYYDIEHAHPRCLPADVEKFCLHPPEEFAQQAMELKNIQKQLSACHESVPRLKQLPHQLVHGDIIASNVLAGEDELVFAILDFEFVTNDLRVIEPSVCFGSFIRPEEGDERIWERLEAFLAGYGSVLKLTEAEIMAIPLLIQLRRLDVFLHFLGRYWDGVDEANVVKEQIQNAKLRTGWVQRNREKLLALCIKYLA